MPTKKKATSTRKRVSTAARRVRRAATGARRAVHRRTGMLGFGGQKWGETALYFLGGYFLKPALEGSGILALAANMFPALFQQSIGKMAALTGSTGSSSGPWGNYGSGAIAKTAGLIAFFKPLLEHKVSQNRNSLIPFGLGAMVDPPNPGSGYGGGMASQDRWSCA